MNSLDKVISLFSPDMAVKRLAARTVLASYEAATPSRQRKFRNANQSQNNLVGLSGKALRNQIRYLERNHDIARGAIRTLVNNVVGANGIGIEPQPRIKGSKEIHQDYANALRDLWVDWQRKPEVTWGYRWPALQRLMARTWLRDGEGFTQLILGNVAGLQHGTRVPFSLELLEADLIPLDYNDISRNIRQGIQRNSWGRSTGYWVYKADPLETGFNATQVNLESGYSSLQANLKYIAAEKMLHLASIDRVGQLRGVSEFASVITRLEDIKDYEESERVAAKVAAMLTAYVKRGSPDSYEANTNLDAEGNPLPRDISMSPGMIIDTLAAGEEIGLIDSNRPNPNLITFRQGQLRAVAAGIGASYSSMSRDYNGTYSAQRQELVEQWIHYATLADEFTGQFVQPVWENFVLATHLSGVLPIPKDVDISSVDDALFVAQSMPWIDPAKESSAWLELVQAGFASEVEVMRKRGVNPRDVLEQIDSWRNLTAEKGLKFSSDFANDKGQLAQQNQAQQAANNQDNQASQTNAAMASLAANLGVLASREQAAPNVVINQGDVTVNTPDTNIDVAAPVVNVEPAAVTIENTIEPTPVTVQNNIENNVQASDVILNSPISSQQTVVRDEKTQEVIKTITEFNFKKE